MSDDLFGGPTNEEPVIDQEKEYLPELVGEDKKYKTPEELAKAAIHKDNFIEQLKRENAEMRDAIAKRSNEEEFLKKLEQVARPKSPESQDPPVERRDEQVSAIKPEDIERIIEEREVKRQREANLKVVSERLQELYGADYRSRVQSQAKALGVGTDFLTDVAAKNPQAFFRLVGLEEQKKKTDDVFTAPPRSSFSTPPKTTVKNYEYFKKLRQEKGDGWYFSLPVQQEIWTAAKEAERRGERFVPEE